MKSAWQSKTNANSLIVFCNGWGMDEFPFLFLEPGLHDVCILYDYRDLALPASVQERLSGYRRRYLVSWSMGVWAGQHLFSKEKDQFIKRMAINGTLLPISDRFGIPLSLYEATLASFDDNGQQRFYRRMCREAGVLQNFLEVKPRRQVDDQKQELSRLRDMVNSTGNRESIYTEVLVSDNDLVIPTVNQQAFWQQQYVLSIGGCHFPFFRWASWDELLGLVNNND